MTSTPPTSSPDETLRELLRLSGRGYTKVRHIIVERGEGDARTPGVVGQMVTDRKRRSLVLYLLLLTVWPWLSKQDTPLPAGVWARALSAESGRKWSPTIISEAWSDLRDRGLVETERKPRGLLVTPMREDAAILYTDPGAKSKDHNESYFTLPVRFWTEGLHDQLSMPALAMLLAMAARTSSPNNERTWLTNKDAARWYGLSPRSVEAGLAELEKLDLLSHEVEWVKAPLSAVGATKRHWYELTGEFSTTQRLAMQDHARLERERRTGSTTVKKATAKPTKKGKGRGGKTVLRKASASKRTKKVAATGTQKSVAAKKTSGDQ